jgi:hypothetical protein
VPALGVVAVAGLLAVGAAVAPPRWVVRILVATLLLVPAPLVVPNPGTVLPTVGRVVVVAALAGLLWRVATGRLPRSVLEATPLHAAVILLLVVTMVVGVGAAADTTPVGTSVLEWVLIAEQALVFVVALAWMRALDSAWQAARIIAGVAGLLALLGLIEQLTGWSWGQWWFLDLPSQQGLDAAQPLSERAGTLRVRGPAEFPLEFGWVVVALLPTTLAVAARARGIRFLPVTAAAALLALGAYWAVARTATAAVGVVLILALIAVADRRLAVVGAVGVMVAVLAVVLAPSLLDPVSIAADEGAIQIRSIRLPEILAVAADRPWMGLGLSGLEPFGFPTTDSSYLLTYAELGVIGLSALLGVFAVAIAQVLRGVAVGRAARSLPIAALLGMVALLVGAWAFDAFSVMLAARTFWLLAAVGTLATEETIGAVGWRPTWTARRAAVPVGAVLGGIVVAVAATVPVAAMYRFETLTPIDESVGFDPVSYGDMRIASACTILTIEGERTPGTVVRCRDREDGAGVGELRIEAGSEDAVDVFVEDGEQIMDRYVGWFDTGLQSPADRARPTPWTTAPLWAGLVGLVVALLAPGIGERRRV